MCTHGCQNAATGILACIASYNVLGRDTICMTVMTLQPHSLSQFIYLHMFPNMHSYLLPLLQVVITSGDSITIPFSGTDTDAFAISLQQCAGNAYLRTSLGYNGTTLYENAPLDTNYCNRVSRACAACAGTSVTAVIEVVSQ